MSVNAGIGLGNYVFDDATGFWRWVELCEAGGIDSIWQSDRLIGNQPNLECMSVMGALAGATTRIKFGMNVASLGLRDPIITAKACATIDVLSGGRLLPAFGVGSALGRDYSASGRPTKGRGNRTNEALQILSRLWTEESVDFDGSFYQLEDASISPRPIQNPLPLWVGGSAAQAIERTARWGTGWQAGLDTPEQIAPIVTAIKARADELNRKIDEDHYGAGFGFRFGSPDDPVCRRQLEALTQRLGGKSTKGFVAIGDLGEIMSLLTRFHTAGAHKFILRPIASGTDDMIDQTQRMIDQILPEVAKFNA